MLFRKALAADGNRCLEIYNKVCDWEDVNGRQTFWDKIFYPNMDTVQKALDADEMYVLENEETGKIIRRTLMYTLLTTLAASTLAAVLFFIIKPEVLSA